MSLIKYILKENILSYINNEVEDYLYHVTTDKAIVNNELKHPHGGKLFFDFHYSLDMETWVHEIIGEYGGRPILIKLPKSKIGKYNWFKSKDRNEEMYVYTTDGIDVNDIEIIKLNQINESYTTDSFQDDYDEDIDNYDDFYYRGNEVEDEDELYEMINDITSHAVKTFKQKINIFKSINIRIVDDEHEDRLGTFVYESGFKLKPYILLHINAIRKSYYEGYNLEDIIYSTIYHELGHAMVEVDNFYIFNPDDNILNVVDEEQYVEDFSFNFYNFGRIPPEVNELEKQVKRIGTEDIDIDEDFLL